MDDPGSSMYLLGIVCLVLSAVFSGSESVLLSSDYVRLKSAFGDHKGQKKALRLKRNPQIVLSGMLLGNTFANVVFASTTANIVAAYLGSGRKTIDLVATLVGTLLLLLFGEITPKFIGTSNPEAFLVRVSSGLLCFQNCMRPVSGVLQKIAEPFSSFLPRTKPMAGELSEARLLGAVNLGETSGAIRNDEKRMIHAVINCKELDVADVMVPRPDMVAMDENKVAADGLNLMLECGFSRIPVFADTRDNVTGIVNIKDLVGLVGSPRLFVVPLKELAVAPHFVPERKSVRNLLREMKTAGIHMAIAVDEFDGVSGLVTLEDLVEEIVGDIRDEYDAREAGAVAVGGSWEVPGRMSLADLRHATGIEPDVEGCDSVAGVLMKCLDKVPVAGDVVYLKAQGLRLEVKDASGPRVGKILVSVEKREGLG